MKLKTLASALTLALGTLASASAAEPPVKIGFITEPPPRS